MSHVWKTTELTSEDEVLKVLMELQGQKWMTRGQSRFREKLVPSIDRDSLAGLPRSEKLQYERQSIDLFRATARAFSSDGERLSLREDLVALMVLRHHQVPTRFLDWSQSPYVAAYFAVSERDEDDGEIWSFDYTHYVSEGKNQWRKWPENTTDGSGDADKFDATLTAFCVDEPNDWIVVLSYLLDFPRQSAQLGHYSMTARFDVDHASKLKALLGEPDRYHRYVIKANLKQALRTTLREKHGIWRGSLFPDTAGAAETARAAFPNQAQPTPPRARSRHTARQKLSPRRG